MSNLAVKKILFGIASLLAAIVLLLANTIPAYAGGGISTKDITSKTSNETLSGMLHHDRVWRSKLQGPLTQEKLKPMRTTFAHLMAAHKASASQIELHKNAFEADISRAKDLQSLTKALLEAHNGFDNENNVIDREAAIATLQTAETYLTNANYWIKSAKHELTLARRYK